MTFKRVLCPGSFDPISLGHLDVITRAAAMFDEVIVGVGQNSKKNYLFGSDRVQLVEGAVAELPNVTVTGFDGLLVEFCRNHDIPAVVKGLRFGSDFDFELQMAHMNQSLTGLETVLLPAAAPHVTLSSTIVREVIRLGGDVTAYVPQNVVEAIAALDTENDLG